MATIMVAEDETAINRVLCKNIELVGHRAIAVYDGEAAISTACKDSVDLILLDIMMPGVDGYQVKAEIPQNIPVIFLTAKANLQDKLKGLNLGADDYITKPFEVLEVLARIQMVLRRAGKTQRVFSYKKLAVDFDSRSVTHAGRPVALTPQEFSLLETLIVNRNLAMSREQLLVNAWGYDYEGESRTVDNHILRLRRKLHLEEEIQTVFKMGYRFAIEDEKGAGA